MDGMVSDLCGMVRCLKECKCFETLMDDFCALVYADPTIMNRLILYILAEILTSGPNDT